MWIVWAIAVVVFLALSVAMYLLTPKPKTETSDPNELEVPTTELGTKLRVVFGTVHLQNVSLTWYGDVTVEPVMTESGGKK